MTGCDIIYSQQKNATENYASEMSDRFLSALGNPENGRVENFAQKNSAVLPFSSYSFVSCRSSDPDP